MGGKTSLYCTFLIHYTGVQSSTIKSYVSGIKAKLKGDGYEWDDKLVWLSALTKACKIKNDVIINRLPIRLSLLHQLLFEIKRKYNKKEALDIYLKHLYMTMFLVAYFGLLRIGELCQGEHVIKAVNVHVAENKQSVLFILYSSKTHGPGDRPQKLKIRKTSGTYPDDDLFCPVDQVNKYVKLRPEYLTDDEQFFVFSDNTPVTPNHVRTLLRELLSDLKLDPGAYETHSFRIGRATDMLKSKVPLEEIKREGRWRSNAVYKYLRD